jgi:hypothetical protein
MAPSTPAEIVSFAAPAPLAVQPALVALAVEHGYARGHLRVFVDERLVFERTLVGSPTRRLLVLKRPRGGFTELLPVAPGARLLRVEVLADGTRRSGQLRASLKSDEVRLLEVKLDGEVGLEWKS